MICGRKILLRLHLGRRRRPSIAGWPRRRPVAAPIPQTGDGAPDAAYRYSGLCQRAALRKEGRRGVPKIQSSPSGFDRRSRRSRALDGRCDPCGRRLPAHVSRSSATRTPRRCRRVRFQARLSQRADLRRAQRATGFADIVDGLIRERHTPAAPRARRSDADRARRAWEPVRPRHRDDALSEHLRQASARGIARRR